MLCLVQPSKVWDGKFVCSPPEEEVVGSEGFEEGGKWILVYHKLDMSFVDRTWAALQPLLRDGTLLMLKAATARLGLETAVVQCYVRGGLEEAKRTAGLIRAAVDDDDYKGIMYYKSNKMSLSRRCGYKRISLYMHTHRGRFYVRDPWGEWILEEANGQRDVSIPSKFRKENYTGSEELPSTSSKSLLFLHSSRKGQNCSWKGLNCWNLRCKSSEDDREYLPESDRVWIVARKLLSEGNLTGISWVNNAQCIQVRLYFPANCSLTSQLDACDKIFRETSVKRMMMYFTRDTTAPCKYTPEREFYEKTGFAEKFVLQR